MKKKIVILALFIICCTFHSVSAQKIGYQGKRFLVNFDTKYRLFFDEIDFDDFFEPEFFLFFSPNIEYIVMKNASIGLSLNYNTDVMNYSISYDNEANYDYTSLGAELFYKQYLNRKDDFYQAPFGVYLCFKLSYSKYFIDFPAYTYNNSIYGGRLEIGIDYLILDRIRLSWGISTGLSTAFLSEYYSFFDNAYSSTAKKGNKQFSKGFGLQHKFGIGILLF